MMFLISRLTSMFHLVARETLSWQGLTALLSEPCQSPCTRQTCSRVHCPYKRGSCWSPATFTKTSGSSPREIADELSLLVFDIDHLTDDQIDEIRGRLSSLQYLVHSTHSDRHDSRYLRIVFPLSRPVTAAAWSSFWHTVRERLVPIADPACADPGRIYFLPSCPQDASYFIQVNAGLLLDVDAMLKSADHASVNLEPRNCLP